jgi:hypothetical protein
LNAAAIVRDEIDRLCVRGSFLRLAREDGARKVRALAATWSKMEDAISSVCATVVDLRLAEVRR